MNEFIGRHPVWSLAIIVAIVIVVWLVFAPWPPGFEAVFGKKKLFLNASFNGITLGGLYFLVASGFTLIFGLMRNVNLATGNHAMSKRAKKGAIRKLLSSSRFLLPVHDRPARIEGGAVVARLGDAVPRPTVQTVSKRNWFPM